MKKFKFLFLIALIATMFIGCAQSADDDTPIIPVSEPEAQPTDIYEAAFNKSTGGNDWVYKQFSFNNETYEFRIPEGAVTIGNKTNNYSWSVGDYKVRFNVYDNIDSIIIISSLSSLDWRYLVDNCYIKL